MGCGPTQNHDFQANDYAPSGSRVKFLGEYVVEKAKKKKTSKSYCLILNRIFYECS